MRRANLKNRPCPECRFLERRRENPVYGMSGTPEYKAYDAAKQRCTNPNANSYKNYGARGIEFRFKSFAEFFAVLGPRPEGMTLDRPNNDGHYEAGNVAWRTPAQQARNRRDGWETRRKPNQSVNSAAKSAAAGR
jgi:hypothetical protein